LDFFLKKSNRKHELKAGRQNTFLLEGEEVVIALEITSFEWRFTINRQELAIINQSCPNGTKIKKNNQHSTLIIKKTWLPLLPDRKKKYRDDV